MGSGRKHTEQQRQQRCDDEGDEKAGPWRPTEIQASATLGHHVSDRKTGDAEDQPLRKRHHAAVRGQKYES